MCCPTDLERIVRVAKALLLVLMGAIAGSVFVLSCGDNWHFATDAAIDVPQVIDALPACDCPAVEPPLAGRFVVYSNLRYIPGNDYGSQSVGCPVGMGMLQLSGSCTSDLSDPLQNMTLWRSGATDDLLSGWLCDFRNHDPTPVTMRVSVICLKPAP
jgi:hypothetical protein